MAILEIELNPYAAEHDNLTSFLNEGLPRWDYSAVILKQGLTPDDLSNMVGLFEYERRFQNRGVPIMPDCAFTAKVGNPLCEKVSEWFARGLASIPQVGLNFQLEYGSVLPHRDDISERPFVLSTAISQSTLWQTQLASQQHLDKHSPIKKRSYGIPFDQSVPIDAFAQNPGDTVIIPGYGYNDRELPSIHAVSASPGRIALINHFVIVNC